VTLLEGLHAANASCGNHKECAADIQSQQPDIAKSESKVEDASRSVENERRAASLIYCSSNSVLCARPLSVPAIFIIVIIVREA